MSKILYPSFKSYKSLETYNQKYFGSGNTTTLSNYKMRLKTYRRKGWCNTAKKTLRSMAKDHKKLDLDLQDLIVLEEQLLNATIDGKILIHTQMDGTRLQMF